MPAEAPLIDSRTYDELVGRLEELVQYYTGKVALDVEALLGRELAQDVADPAGGLLAVRGIRIDDKLAKKLAALPGLSFLYVQGWQPALPGQDLDPGGALIRLFARLAEIVISRLNRVPEKSFLAFLNLVGARLGPPRPARVPLTFHLAAGSLVDAVVPAGTQAAAPPREGEKAPVLFTTERELVVTRSRLAAVFVHEPAVDLWKDSTDVATGLVPGVFDPFQGEKEKLIEHALYLRHSSLAEPPEKDVILKITLMDAAVPWPPEVVWEIGKDGGWSPIENPEVEPEAPETWKITLSGVPPLANFEVAGRIGPWLRGRLDRPLKMDEPLPRIKDLKLGVHIAVPLELALAPDLAFVNQAPVDPKKDFFPFGEKPRVGDALYLASDEAFGRIGANVTLHLVPTNPGQSGQIPPPANPSGDVKLEWQHWDGRAWKTFGTSGPQVPLTPLFQDDTFGLKKAGDVTFVCPNVLPVAVGGEIHRWIRVRLAAGNYGFDLSFEEIEPTAPPITAKAAASPDQTLADLQAFRFVPPSFKPPSLRSIQVGYDYTSDFKEPAEILTINDFEVRSQVSTDFAPFLLSAERRPALYLGFERPGDTVGFANRPVALYFGFEEALFEAGAEPRPVTTPPVLAWEFWNGAGWQPLGVRDETRGFTRRGIVTFIGPSRFPASQRFGRTAFWLRVRWEGGDWTVRPNLRRVLTNTVWAVNAQTVAGEVLGSSRGERSQSFRIHRTPVLPGQRLEVREPEIPTVAEQKVLESEEGEDAVRVVRDAAGHPTEVWVRWHETPDFYASGPRSRHYLLDRASGEVRFGDGQRGLVPPPGTGNVRMATYQVGGGTAGNRPAGSIAQIKGTIPYVDSVINDEPADGGAAEESLDTARVLSPRRLRHRDRATALSDFEDLALEASPEVARAKAVGATDAPTAGSVGLLVVPRSGSSQPIPSLALLDVVRTYVEQRLSPVVDLWVAGPDWLQVTVQVEIVPRVLEEASEVQSAVRSRIDGFLHPLTGGPDGTGWAFGRRPYDSDLYAWIEATSGVDHVRWLRVEPPQEDKVKSDRFLIFPGAHQITLASSTDEAANGGGGSTP